MKESKWHSSEVHEDPHFLLSSTRAANKILDLAREESAGGRLRVLTMEDLRPAGSGGQLWDVPVGWATVSVSEFGDFETRKGTDDEPQPGRALMNDISGVSPRDVITPITEHHTSQVNVVKSRDDLVYIPTRGANALSDVKGDPLLQDGVILIESEETKNLVIEIPDADCVKVVGSAQLASGERVVFGAHCGFRGTQRGMVENLARKLQDLGITPGSTKLFIGYGSQNVTIPTADLANAALENPNPLTREHWSQAISGEFHELNDPDRAKVTYSNQSDVIGRVMQVFVGGGLVSKDEGSVVILDENTVTSPTLRSYRGATTLKARHGEPPIDKSGRNITRITFS
jgi:hypothetical protein